MLVVGLVADAVDDDYHDSGDDGGGGDDDDDDDVFGCCFRPACVVH